MFFWIAARVSRKNRKSIVLANHEVVKQAREAYSIIIRGIASLTVFARNDNCGWK